MILSDLCPVCESESVTGGSGEIEQEHARQVVTCDDCYAIWECEYALANIHLISVNGEV